MKAILIKLGFFVFSLVFMSLGLAAILKFMGNDNQTKVAIFAFLLIWILLTIIVMCTKIGPSEPGSSDETQSESGWRSWFTKFIPGLLIIVILLAWLFGVSYLEAFLAMATTAGSILLAGAMARGYKGGNGNKK